VVLRSEEELRATIVVAIERLTGLLRRLLPGAAVDHIGATAVPGSLTKGDLDLMVSVPAEEFDDAVAVLGSEFERSHPEEWTRSLASFNEVPEVELPVGIQLVVAGSIAERVFAGWRDRLRDDAQLLAAYNAFKTDHAGNGYEQYTEAKGRFIERAIRDGVSDLRPAEPGDHRDIVALWTQAFVEPPNSGRDLPYEVQDVEATAQAGELFVIEERVDLVAVIGLSRAGEGPGAVSREDELEISRLAVALYSRGRGFARRLVAHCHSCARERGVSDIVLWSRPNQSAAHSLYRSFGYVRLPERDRTSERGEQIVFGVRLDRPSP
jgi:GrpB-like predicted nucleotidyltransferase (UPF0157 family)/ribosomal protein S18 acetylase RimI-like enzyme